MRLHPAHAGQQSCGIHISVRRPDIGRYMPGNEIAVFGMDPSVSAQIVEAVPPSMIRLDRSIRINQGTHPPGDALSALAVNPDTSLLARARSGSTNSRSPGASRTKSMKPSASRSGCTGTSRSKTFCGPASSVNRMNGICTRCLRDQVEKSTSCLRSCATSVTRAPVVAQIQGIHRRADAEIELVRDCIGPKAAARMTAASSSL